MLLKWEEPCLVSGGGAGTIFFSGCNLGCIFCQNRAISRGGCGNIMSENELEREMFALIENGASCIEFVTPTHYTDKLAKLLSRIKCNIPVPVVGNSGGYESVESLRTLDGLIDIYMPDFKYFSPELSKKYSNAENYATVALDALKEQLRQVGKPRYNEDGMLLGGVILRHLILPSHRADSINVLGLIAKEIGAENLILSLMGQYTPDFYLEDSACRENTYKNLCRRITSFEYDSVLGVAESLGFDGYFQSLSSASKEYTPDF
jgi:putative pyruvate formate lyase activating enzyme